MKPQDLYRGQAPAAMGMMGQGLAEVGSNIARTTLAGYQALGEGIAGGIKSAASAVTDAYKEKKKLDAQNKADEGFVKTMLPYLPESIRDDFAARHEDLMSDPSASALDKAAFYHSAKSYLGQAVQQDMALQRIKEENLGRKEIALTTGMMPYVLPAKGSTMAGVDQFVDPNFLGGNQPVPAPDNSALKSSYDAFQKEVPGGTPDQFAAWQAMKTEELKKKAAASKVAPDFTISPY
jgi:hypothetical protein